ncbi:MAG TPA: hypothetical protein VGQ72_10825 [Pyrinomonadaceae bacterium]|nr:hypothetical protein [Pyrinomonadaceae bacterium]
MKSLSIKLLSFAIVLIALGSVEAWGQRRVVVRHPGARHPVARARLVVRPGHPIHRVLPANVVVRTARRAVIVNHPLVYLPTLAWRASVASLPARERLVWQDSETISRDEEWVDTNYGIDASGDALFLDIDGKAKLNFAEVTFENGQVQVVDFNEKTYNTGVYNLLDFADGRHVANVRILAKSESDDTKLSVYLSK